MKILSFAEFVLILAIGSAIGFMCGDNHGMAIGITVLFAFAFFIWRVNQ